MERKKPFFINNKFYNQKKETVLVRLKDVIIHYCLNVFNKSHLYNKENVIFPVSYFYKHLFLDFLRFSADDLVVIPLGHATVLILYKNKTILFDPIFNTSSIFLKRYASIIDVNYLPRIDVVVYSHNHPDHYNHHDLLLLIARFPSVQIVSPLGFDIFFKKEGLNYQYLSCLNWWDEIYLLDGIFKLTALPAIHWSQSNFSNRNETLWGSWMITIKNCNIYFAGDSAYGDHFKEIKDYFNKINIACLPIAPYEPKSIQFDSHMNSEESFQAFLDLGSPVFIPIHWGVFAYGDEPLRQPIEKIIKLFCDYDLNSLNKLQSTTINVPYIYQI